MNITPRKRAFVVGGKINTSYDFVKNLPHILTYNIEEADLAIFTGGADVYPGMYGEKVGEFTHYDIARDAREQSYYEILLRKDIPMLGICRGAQFLTVMNGGSLIQHVTNHGVQHAIHLPQENRNIYVTSTHHQMMYPFDLDEDYYQILGYSEERSEVYLNGNGESIELPQGFVEPEIVFYPETECLCIQGHPEHCAWGHPFAELTRKLIDQLL